MEDVDNRKFDPPALVESLADVCSDPAGGANDKGAATHSLFIVEELEDSAKPPATSEDHGGASASPAAEATLGDGLNPPKEKIRRHSSYESPRLSALPAARPSRKISLAASVQSVSRRKEAYKYNHAPLSIASGTIEDDEADAQRIRRALGIPFDEDFSRKNYERDAIQKKTFTKWVNKHLKKAGKQVRDLFEDLRDGHNLISLLEVLSGEHLPRERGRLRFHMLQNVQLTLDFLRYRKIKLVNIRCEDIVDGNPKLTLGLIWTIILHFQK